MKRRKLGWISLLLVGMLGLGGCQSKGTNLDQAELKEIRVGVLFYNQDDLFINTMAEKLDEGFREQEKKEDFKVTVNFSDAKGSQTAQNDQIDKFIAQDYDVLCVNIVDRTDAAVIVDKGRKADIPIVFFNREPVSADMERWDKTYYVGVDSEDGGRLQGEIFLQWYEKDKKGMDRNKDGVIQYVILEGEQGHQDTTIRTESCLKTIKEAGVKLERLATTSANWRRTQAKEKMDVWLKEFGDEIEVLVSNNDEMALGALDAIEEHEIPDGQIKIIGLDGLEEAKAAVKEGKMIGTVLNDVDSQAKSVIDLAIRLGKGEDLDETLESNKNRVLRVPHQKIIQY